MPENSSRLGDAFSLAMYQMSPLSECVSHIAIKDTKSRIFLCGPWESILLWANKVEDRYLSYGDTKFESHYASLNYCISGRCEVCLPDNTYTYMEPGMLCIDDHKPKGGYWYPGQNYSGLEVVFDLDRLLEHPLSELSVYFDYDGWIRKMLSAHDGTYLGVVGNECDRLINLLYSHTDMAAMYGVSPSALKKYFEVVYGLPISFYLRERQILLAKQWLSETKESVGLIAAACGYTSQGKFGFVFRECTGMSPLEYRRLNYKENKEGGNNDSFK